MGSSSLAISMTFMLTSWPVLSLRPLCTVLLYPLPMCSFTLYVYPSMVFIQQIVKYNTKQSFPTQSTDIYLTILTIRRQFQVVLDQDNKNEYNGLRWWRINQLIPSNRIPIFQGLTMWKKIPFGLKIFKKASFLKLAQDWSAVLNIDAFVHQHYFKYLPRFIVELDKQFICNTIKYSIAKRFPLLFSQSFDDQILSLSSKIKESYALLNIKVIMKMDAYFYFLSVFLTKVVSKFLAEIFQDIDIDKELQSQIYIILVFVIIGLEVAPKTYHVNHKKIIYQKYLHKNRPKSLGKLDTIESLHEKRSSNKINPQKVNRKLMIQRKWTNISCKEQQNVTPLDQFKQNLKENLLVKALPKLVKKKIKGSDFDYNADRHEAQLKGDQKKYIFLRQSQTISQPNHQFINSNQNSLSFQYFFKSETEKRHYFHRNVKISHRHQLLLNTKSLRNEQYLKSEIDTPENKNEKIDDEKLNKNWKNIVKQIRQHAFQTNKINSFIQTADEFMTQMERKSKVETVRASLQDSPQRFTLAQSEKQCILMPKPTNFGSYWIHEKQQPFAVVEKDTNKQLHPKKVHRLRRERHNFDQNCEKRHHMAHYSMFNISNTLTIFRK